MRRMILLCLVLAVALPANAGAVADFKTPAGAAFCGFVEQYAVANPTPTLICWTPNDGFTVTMRPRAHPKARYVANNAGSGGFAVRTLRFGQSWWGDATRSGIGSGAGRDVLFRCVSRRTGLTCTSKAGHGWWLGRYHGYRIF